MADTPAAGSASSSRTRRPRKGLPEAQPHEGKHGPMIQETLGRIAQRLGPGPAGAAGAASDGDELDELEESEGAGS